MGFNYFFNYFSMTYTYLVSAKKRTTLQKVFAGFMVLSLNLSMGGAMAFVAPSVASADAPVRNFSGVISPTTVPAGTTQTLVVTFTNSNSSNRNIKSATIARPTGWTPVTSIVLGGAAATGFTASYNSTSQRIEVSSTGSSSIAPGNSFTVSFIILPPTSSGSTGTFILHAYENNSFSSGRGAEFNQTGSEPTVTTTVVTYPLNVTVAPSGSGSVTSNTGGISCGAACAASYNSGANVVLTATPAPGYAFTSWTGCDTPTGATCAMTMNAAKSVTANFSRLSYTLSVAKAGTGSGTVSSPSSISCGATCSTNVFYGSVVTLTAIPDSGSSFSGWTGCDVTAGPSCTVNVFAARSVNAMFDLLPPENTLPLCSDGVDNDGDGQVDLADVGCAEFKPMLTVVKHVVGGPLSAVNFLLHVNDGEGFPGSETGTSFSYLAAPFQYSVTESPAAEYNASYDNCSGVIGIGGHETCTVTNSYDVCANLVGNQASVPAGYERSGENCILIVTPPTTCPTGTTGIPPDCTPVPPTTCEENLSTVTVVSDATNNVVEDAIAAVPTYAAHPAWTASIPGATWIWSSFHVAAPTTQETKTFTKTFTVTGTVTGATLDLAADNNYKVWVNGTEVSTSVTGTNFAAATTVTVPTALFVQGSNEIKMEVTNLAGDANPESNPAGALYKLTITKNACVPTPAPVCDPEVNLLANGDFEAPVVSGWSIIPFTNSALKWLGAFVAPQTGGNLGLELQASVAGSPFAGLQHAELDGDHPVRIWQNVPLMSGYDYELSTMYSPRPGSNAADNTLQFQLNGVALGANVARDGSTNANTVWTKESRTFTAGAASADVGFAEVGTDSSLGVYLDNASLRCVQKHVPAATIVATKVVCDNETDLPDWSGSGHVIDATTATDYVSQKEGACRIVPDWKFQWAPTSASNPGDNTGEAADWHTFVSSVSIALGDMTSVWMREVYDSAYIPFTGTADTDKVSAEMYCNGDVVHYDNLDYARNLTDGGTVYCVAFNVLKKEVPPTDVCPNIEGTQSVLPEGMMLVEGQCVETTPSITVVKHVVNDNGGTKQASDFTLRVNIPEQEEEDMALLDQVKAFFSVKTAIAGTDRLYAPASFSGNEEGTKVYFEGPTEFNVVEPEHPGYDVTYTGDCRGSIALGEHLTCVVTNDDKSQGGGGNGSTDTPYPGCMNPEATNFNRLANRDDGSCQLPQSQQPTGGETAPQGEVLGAATTEPDLSLPASCGEYLSDYLRYGKKNNPEQVKLLQSFLNEYVEANLPVTGFFGKMTHNAVKKFQVKYHAEIIKPWIDAGYKDKDIENGTGYVFKTTKREINLLKCSSLNIPMPELKAE